VGAIQARPPWNMAPRQSETPVSLHRREYVRLNEANVEIHTLKHLEAFVSRALKHRLTYEEYTA